MRSPGNAAPESVIERIVRDNIITSDSHLRQAVRLAVLLNLAYFAVELTVARSIGSVSRFAASVDFLEDAVYLVAKLSVFRALSDQCGACGATLLAGGDEPQISSKAVQSIPLLQLIARGDPPERSAALAEWQLLAS